VAQLLGWKKEKATAPQRQLFVLLKDKGQQVVKRMSATPKRIDLIVLDASLKISDVSSVLFQLEIKGVGMTQAGKLFKLLYYSLDFCVRVEEPLGLRYGL
jgi:predicted Rossmann fold nucleotide-binding protein DprA/Smf involved in DNA uptake